MVKKEMVVEKNQRGMSWAGEVTTALVIGGIVFAGGLAYLVYLALSHLYSVAIELLGWGFVNGVLLALPVAGFLLLVVRVGLTLGHLWEAKRIDLDARRAEATQAQLQAQYVQPNEAGLYPVDRRLLDVNSDQALQLAIAHQRARWTVADVPHSLTYSPRYNNRQDVQGLQPGQDVPQIAAPQPEGFWQLFNNRQLPEHGFLMGYDLESHEAITADWSKLYSALIGGQSGSGKSTLIRNILAQSALQGGKFIVLDPHYGAGDESLGASLQSLRHLMLTDVAATEKQMLDSIAYIRDIGQRRLAGRDRDKTPVVLIVDETTALLQRSSVAEPLTDALGEIAQETRKAGVYAMCIGQNFSGSVMPTTVRDSFVSFLSCRARRNVARVMTSDAEFGKAAQKLQRGQAVWTTPGGETHRFAIPNCTAHDLELVAQHTKNGVNNTDRTTYALPPVKSGSHGGSHGGSQGGSQVVHNSPKVNHRGTSSEPVSEPLVNHPVEPGKMARIAGMLEDGAGINAIIRDVFGVNNKGKAWQAARAELQQVMDYIGGENE